MNQTELDREIGLKVENLGAYIQLSTLERVKHIIKEARDCMESVICNCGHDQCEHDDGCCPGSKCEYSPAENYRCNCDSFEFSFLETLKNYLLNNNQYPAYEVKKAAELLQALGVRF